MGTKSGHRTQRDNLVGRWSFRMDVYIVYHVNIDVFNVGKTIWPCEHL